MKLYCHPASTTSRIVMLYCAEEVPEVELQVVDLFTGEHLKPEYAKINPNRPVRASSSGAAPPAFPTSPAG